VLKGGRYLPSDVTGKLSDFAGLMVAPLLLAVLLRVRTRRGWWAAHVAVAAVFAGIQLSRSFADVWSDAMGLFGFPWAITCDPTDLVALPMLLLSAWAYPQLVTATARRLARRNAEVAAAAGGLACCVATSPPQPNWTPTIDADVYIHNGNDYPMVVRVRGLKPEVDLDCDAVSEAPGRLLDEALFGDATGWNLEADANMVLLTEEESVDWGWDTRRPDRPCHAYLLDVDNVTPTVVFWRQGELPQMILDGTGLDESHLGYIDVQHDEDGRGTLEAGENILFQHPDDVVPPQGACGPADESRRLIWSADLPSGDWILGTVDNGVDGCVELELRTGFEASEDLEGRTEYVCLPPGSFPFSTGDAIRIGVDAYDPATSKHLSIQQIDPETGLELEDGASLVASAGERVDDVFGASATFTDLTDCGAATEPACGTASKAGRITLSGGEVSTVELSGGTPKVEVAARSGGVVTLHLVHAQRRLVLDPECADGPDTLGTDIELVAVHRYGA
jgi:hypothetical protein